MKKRKRQWKAMGRVGNYRHYKKRGASKRKLSKRSIRTVRIGKHGKLLRVGCPKGYWRRGRCRKGLKAFSMLVPASGRNPAYYRNKLTRSYVNLSLERPMRMLIGQRRLNVSDQEFLKKYQKGEVGRYDYGMGKIRLRELDAKRLRLSRVPEGSLWKATKGDPDKIAAWMRKHGFGEHADKLLQWKAQGTLPQHNNPGELEHGTVLRAKKNDVGMTTDGKRLTIHKGDLFGVVAKYRRGHTTGGSTVHLRKGGDTIKGPEWAVWQTFEVYQRPSERNPRGGFRKGQHVIFRKGRGPEREGWISRQTHSQKVIGGGREYIIVPNDRFGVPVWVNDGYGDSIRPATGKNPRVLYPGQRVIFSKRGSDEQEGRIAPRGHSRKLPDGGREYIVIPGDGSSLPFWVGGDDGDSIRPATGKNPRNSMAVWYKLYTGTEYGDAGQAFGPWIMRRATKLPMDLQEAWRAARSQMGSAKPLRIVRADDGKEIVG